MQRRILVAATLLLIAGPANAATIRYTASGTLSPNFGSVPVPTGTVISVDVFLDESTADSNPDSRIGFYQGLTGTLTVGSDVFSINSYNGRGVRIDNNSIGSPLGPSDRIQLNFTGGTFTSPVPAIDGVRLHNMFFSLFNYEGTEFSNDLLANSIGLDPADWSAMEVVVQFSSSTGYVGEANGPMNTFTSAIIPVPAALWLLASALGLLGWVRRKKM